jgi:tRNA(fMet)-specific endonuclease VapC
MYVLDTNTIIYYFKGQGEVAQNLVNIPAQEIIVSTIVVFELQVGIANSNSPEKRVNRFRKAEATPTSPKHIGCEYSIDRKDRLFY